MPSEPLIFKFAIIRRELLHRLPWAVFTVAVFIFLAPNFDFALALAWHDGQRLAQLGVLAFALFTLALPGALKGLVVVWSGLPHAGRWALLTALVLGLISGSAASLPRWALLDWGLLLLLMVLSLSIAANRRLLDERADLALTLLFFGTASAYAVTTCSVYGAMLLVGPAYGQGFDVRELYTSFSSVRFFGHVQTMLLPFLLLPALWWGTTRMRRILLWSVPAIWWMLAVGSGTRGTWVALLAGVIAAALFGGSTGRRWVKWQGAGLLCGLMCYAVFVLGVPQWLDMATSFLHRTDDMTSLSLRGVLWKTALDFAVQHPLLGIGPMHYAYWANEVAAHPHNAVLQWLSEWGVPAGLLLTGVWAAGGIAWAAHVRRESAQGDDRARWFRVALLAALTGASAQAMVDGVLVMPVSQTLLALLAGWAIGMMPGAACSRVAGNPERLFLVAVVLFAAAVVVYGVAPEIGHLAERQQAYLATRGPNTILLPRFWALGWINQ